MSRIFVEQSLATGCHIQLDTAASHYIRNVLRLKTGNCCLLFNADDKADYHCKLVIEGKQVGADIERRHGISSESRLDSEIIQGLGRSDHIDFSIQKCTELGAGRISIFNAQHSQVLLKATQQPKRLAHWRAIAIKACEQCGRHKPPVIQFFSGFEAALENSINRKNKLLLHFEGSPLPDYLSAKPTETVVSLLMGPEGGLSVQEIEQAQQQGFCPVSMGPRVLRTETAAMTALAILQSSWGDMRG